ncbi:MAG: hypothetical protein LBD82_07040, partial [Deltaproteobacteria bacterium]|nr:hypothetical protein [Deltaproteobacteria bacterium]
MRLRTKLLSLTIVPLVLLLGLILLISQMTQRISAMEKAVAQAEVILMREAVPFFNLLNRNYSIAVQLAETISILKNHGRTERGPLISLVRAVQKDNPELFGSWLMFDPDALDDDADFMPEKLEGASVETVRARMRELYGPDADFSPNDVATLEGSFCTYWITDEQKRIGPVTAG